MPDAPYAGLNPFSVDDAPFFFGREHERDLIVANMMASRLTVLYGPSGVGKSSVLNAGALSTLRDTYRRAAPDGKPQVIAAVFRRWNADPAAELMSGLAESIGIATNGGAIEKLATWSTERGGRLLLMLDQFEEYLLYHERADDEFGELLPLVLNRPTLAVNILIGIREDSVARLDAFKGRVPSLFQNYLRLDRLTREAARAAVVRPLERFNELGFSGGNPVTIEPALVDAVLNDVRTGRVTIGEAGRGRVDDHDERIETPYLQLVMKRLWEAERSRHSHVLRLETYRQLGSARRIVEGHLDQTVGALAWRERAIAAAIFEHLVTPSRAKIAHTSADLAKYADVEQTHMEVLLEKLSGPDRILATVAPAADQSPETRYQIFHDVLASAVLAWTTRHRARRQQRRRILQFAGVFLILAVLATIAVLVQRTARQARLIGGLQQNTRDIAEVLTLQRDLRDLAGKNQEIEKQLASLEERAKNARDNQLTAALADARKTVGEVAASNKTLADRATRVGTSLENTQRQIAQSQGVSSEVPPPQVPREASPVQREPPELRPADPAPDPPRPDPTGPSPAVREKAIAAARNAAEAGVRAALRRYAEAYGSLQAQQVANVYPTFTDQRKLQDGFNQLRSYEMVVTPVGPVELTDNLSSATVTCSITGSFQPRVGNRTAIKSQNQTFHLRRGDSDWIITAIQPR